MMNKPEEIKINSKYSFFPVTKEKWKDFEELFGQKGACAGCWCMYWRLRRKEYNSLRGEGTRKKMKSLINKDIVPGILAYYKSQPAGWCSVAPRDHFPVLENSRVLKRIDDKPVWSVVCFYINKNFRRKGLTVELLNAVKKYVKAKKGEIIEGYPVEPKSGKTADVFAWTGLSSAFKKAGFKEVERRSETRPIMRYYLSTK